MFLCLSPAAMAADKAGTVTAFEGQVEVTRESKTVPVSVNAAIHLGDVIETEENSRIQIIFNDKTELTLADNMKMTIDEYVFDPDAESNIKLSVLRGTFAFASGLIKNDNVKIDVPHGTIGIRGTKFLAGELEDTYGIFVEKGAVHVENKAGEVIVGEEEGTKLSDANTAPTPPKVWGEKNRTLLRDRLKFAE